MINIILERLRPWYEAQLTDEQNGFRKNRGTADGILTVKRAHQIAYRKKQTLFLLFVDLTAAFDHVPREWLFRSINLRYSTGKYPRLFQILERLYTKTSLTFPEANKTFETTSGVRQGGPESPFLFNLYVDFAMRVFMEKCSKDGTIKFFQHTYRINSGTFTREERLNMRQQNISQRGVSVLPWCGYADDIILFLLNDESAQRALTLLDEVFKSMGLTINEKKTETMIINCDDLEEYPDSVLTLNGTPLKNTKLFKYLGSFINAEEPDTGDAEVNHRIQIASAKFSQMTNLLQNFRINLRTRVLFLNSFIRSRLTYSCQNWNVNSTQLNRLDTTYRNLLRRMIRGGFKFVDEKNNDFRLAIDNERLHSICGTEDVSNFIMKQQRSYAEHVIRMSTTRNVKLMLFNDDRYTRRGRPTKTLLEQVVERENVTLDRFCKNALSKKYGKST